MWTNSTPVTPDPMTTRCSGSVGGGYAWRWVRTRSPSGLAQSGTRGRLPVASRIASASSSSSGPPGVSTTTWLGPASRPLPVMMRTPWSTSRLTTDRCSRSSMPAIRTFMLSRSNSAADWLSPIPTEWRTKAMAPPVAIMALDGMQSHRWAAPPTTSRSMRVTSAPRRAAAVAAELPAGPPPMMTKRTPATSPR